MGERRRLVYAVSYLAYFNLMTFVDVASAVSGRAALRRKPGETFHWRRSSVMTVTVRLL